MVDLIAYIKKIGNRYGITGPDYRMDVTRLFVSNSWFGVQPIIQDNTIYVNDDEFAPISIRLEEFCSNYYLCDAEKAEYLLNKMKEIFPNTARLLRKYANAESLESGALLKLTDFILYFSAGELQESTDSDIDVLMDEGFDNLSKTYGDILADFINWVQRHAKTIYKRVYFMNKYSVDNKKDAYDPEDYLDILYHLYNSDYIDDNDMYAKAAASKNYVDTWLFLALHFLCALRNTDIVRIPHPRLVDSPIDTLNQVSEGRFPEEHARQVLYSVFWHLNVLMLTPNKTKEAHGVSSIKIHIPESVEVHIGTLFAVAEAHFLIKGLPREEPLIRVIASYEQINRYMGEEIGELFLASDFHSRAANKSYMQMIFLLTDEILGINDEFHVKGYMLAALARSHKGSYGSFAQTTSVYLKDAKMNGYSPEFVAKELFERGVLSFIPSMLLKMICGDAYEKLSVENQTKVIKALNMSPMEVEQSVGIMQTNMKRSVQIVNNVFSQTTKQQVLEILHKIGNGEAVSKSEGCLCLLTAMGKECPFMEISNCPSCDYEISTKTTMYLMVQESQRLRRLYEKSTNQIDRSRCKAMAKNVVIPSIEEMLVEVEEKYGNRAVDILEAIINEATQIAER